MTLLKGKVECFKSIESRKNTDLDTFAFEKKHQIQTESIKKANFSCYQSQVSKASLINTYNDSYKLIYGLNIDHSFINEITKRLKEYNRSFNYLLLLSENTTPLILDEILRKENLFSGDLRQSFIDDVRQDVRQYLSITGEKECFLRLVLEDCSSLYNLLDLDGNISEEDLWSKVKKYIINLGYFDSFVFHIDDYAINFTKVYSGAPTLCIDTEVNKIKQTNFYDQWIECFNQPIDFHSALTKSIFENNRSESIDLINQLLININTFQSNLSHILEDINTYQFEIGVPQFYFGLENKLKTSALLLHARPMIWANDLSAKRFLTLIEPTSEFDYKHFLKANN